MTRDCPYDALDGGVWRRLLCRAAIFRAIGSRLAQLDHGARDRRYYGSSVQRALSNLYETIDDRAPTATDSCTAVATVVRAWRAYISGLLARRSPTLAAARLLRDIYRFAEAARADDAFARLLQPIEAQAKAIYDSSWREVSLSLGHLREHPRRGSRDPYALTAATTVRGESAQIDLNVVVDEFGPASFAAIPLTLVHECICHVPARQDVNENRSVFAEGFLHWAAAMYFMKRGKMVDRELTPAARRHGEGLNKVLLEQISPTWEEREIGQTQADELAAWFEEELSYSPEVAETTVAVLAVQLNRAHRPLVRKDRLVQEFTVRPFPERVASPLRQWEAGYMTAEQLLDLPWLGRGW